MVLTRAERKEALKEALTHVIKNVFELDDDTPLSRALSKEDLLDIDSVMQYPFEDIDKMTYIDDQGDEYTLPFRYTILLHVFKSYFFHRRAQGNPIRDKWTDITYENITDFRVGPDYPLANFPPPTALAPSPLLIKKSVQRDSSVPSVPKDDTIMADPVPKDVKQCDVTEILDKTDSSTILNRTDVPTKNEDHTVSDAKAQRIDTVLELNHQTDQGKVFGLQCEQDFNAQHIDASLDDYSVKSTETSLDASDGNVLEAVADACDIAIGLDTSLAHVTKQRPGGLTIEVPVEDIPPDPDAKKCENGESGTPVGDSSHLADRLFHSHEDVPANPDFMMNGFCAKHDFIFEHVNNSLISPQHVMPKSAIEFEHQMEHFQVELLSSSSAVQCFKKCVMAAPPLRKSYSDITDDVMMTKLKKRSRSIDEVIGLKKISSSVDEVAPQLDFLQQPIFALTPAQDVAMLFADSFNTIDSSDNGEIGTVPVASPILDDADNDGDIFSFVESKMDVLDEATKDIYAFLASLDSGVTVVTLDEDPVELEDVDAFAQSVWDTIPDADRIATYIHKLDIEEVPPETPTDEVPVEDTPPDSMDHGESVLDVDPSRLEDLLDGDANEVVVDVGVKYLGPIVTDPILDVTRHNQPVSTDTVNSDLHAIDSGKTTALLLARPDSSVADVDGRTTKDTIHHCDAPTKKAVYLNEQMLVLDQSRLADRLYRQRHSHGETGANTLYPNGMMPAAELEDADAIKLKGRPHRLKTYGRVQHPGGSHLPFNRWKSLPLTTQAFWDTIPDAECITDVSTETPTDEVPVEDIPPDPGESGTTLLAHATNRQWAQPLHVIWIWTGDNDCDPWQRPSLAPSRAQDVTHLLDTPFTPASVDRTTVESDDVCVKVIDEACAIANGFEASSNHGESGHPIPVGDSSRLAHGVGSLIDLDLVAVTDFTTADTDWDPSVSDYVPDTSETRFDATFNLEVKEPDGIDAIKLKGRTHHLETCGSERHSAGSPMLVVDPSRFADRLYRHHHSHGETMDCLLSLNEPKLVIDPSRLADRLFRYHHSHGETTAQPLYLNEPMPAVDPSRFADRQYRHHHSHGESSTDAFLIPSKHVRFVWKLIEWENGEAAIKSLPEKKTRHILQPLLSIMNNWLSSMSVSLL